MTLERTSSSGLTETRRHGELTRVDYRCEGVTQSARQCRKPADVHLYTAEGECARHYCAQHARGAGAMRLLLPRPWEYDHVERGRQ